jgi:hypothetical protein
MPRKTYEIGGKKFWMDELVLSQEEALADILAPVMGESDKEITVQRMIEALLHAKGLRKALAILLVPEGETVASRDIAAVESFLGDNISLSQQGAVIADFFGCNRPGAQAFATVGSFFGRLQAKAPSKN